MISDDWLLHALSSLPELPPNQGSEEAVRLRCHKELERRANRQRRAVERKRLAGWCVDAGAWLGVCGYLAMVLQTALRLAWGG